MLIVQKYGGTSVASPAHIRRVAERVAATKHQGHQPIVIVSAMAGETNRLVELAQAFGARHGREVDVLLASGEQVTASLMALALQSLGVAARSFLGYQARMITDSSHSRARIRQLDASTLLQVVDQGTIPVIAGFQGVDQAGNITTLGRGGSDTSAVAVAAAVKADLCEIYTDVDGVYTSDPRVCPDARKISRITYDEMMELASLGAKVLQIRSVELANAHGVKLHVRNSHNQEEGTMVVADNPHGEPDDLERVVVTGVSLDLDQARLTLIGAPSKPGLQSAVFGPLSEAGIVVDVIVQNPPIDGRTNLSFTLSESDLPTANQTLENLAKQLSAQRVFSDSGLAKVSIVGVGMRSHSGVAHRMFELLAASGIEILMISTSEIKVSCVIAREHGENAARALHAGFGLAG
ncbi:MAG: aspartate kinase [Deltaproteobacteria bacterium]|nr:aspartate kinase [Deltaproteobacteria bacterium]